MGQFSGGTYVLCDVCTTDGNTWTGVTVTNTPHPVWGNNSGGTVVEKYMVALGGFNGLNS